MSKQAIQAAGAALRHERWGNVLHHPHFDRPRVIQNLPRGRRPKKVVNLYLWKLDRDIAREKREILSGSSQAHKEIERNVRRSWAGRTTWEKIESLGAMTHAVTGVHTHSPGMVSVLSTAVQRIDQIAMELSKEGSRAK